MFDLQAGPATSLALLAIVDALALIGGFFFIWRAARRGLRFVAHARRVSLGAAVRSARRTSHRQATRCATDVSYYLSRLALMFCTNLASIAGIIFAAVCLADEGAFRSSANGAAWREFASISLILFTAFAVRSFYRTIRLTRQVMRIRRNIRSAAARRRRLELSGGADNVGPGTGLRLASKSIPQTP